MVYPPTLNWECPSWNIWNWAEAAGLGVSHFQTVGHMPQLFRWSRRRKRRKSWMPMWLQRFSAMFFDPQGDVPQETASHCHRNVRCLLDPKMDYGTCRLAFLKKWYGLIKWTCFKGIVLYNGRVLLGFPFWLFVWPVPKFHSTGAWVNRLTRQVGTGLLCSENLCSFQETLECNRCFHMFPSCLCIVHPQFTSKTRSRIAQPPIHPTECEVGRWESPHWGRDLWWAMLAWLGPATVDGEGMEVLGAKVDLGTLRGSQCSSNNI